MLYLFSILSVDLDCQELQVRNILFAFNIFDFWEKGAASSSINFVLFSPTKVPGLPAASAEQLSSITQAISFYQKVGE